MEVKKMRRKDRETDRDSALNVVDRCDYGVLSLTAQDGSPYCVPLSVVRIGNDIYFHCAAEGRKLDLLRARPDVCLACVTGVHTISGKFTTAYESAIIEGRASEITEEPKKIQALHALCMKYTPENMADFENAVSRSLACTGIWKISIDKISGKSKKEKN